MKPMRDAPVKAPGFDSKMLRLALPATLRSLTIAAFTTASFLGYGATFDFAWRWAVIALGVTVAALLAERKKPIPAVAEAGVVLESVAVWAALGAAGWWFEGACGAVALGLLSGRRLERLAVALPLGVALPAVMVNLYRADAWIEAGAAGIAFAVGVGLVRVSWKRSVPKPIAAQAPIAFETETEELRRDLLKARSEVSQQRRRAFEIERLREAERVALTLAESTRSSEPGAGNRMAQAILEAVGAESVVLYRLCDLDRRYACLAHAGRPPKIVLEESFAAKEGKEAERALDHAVKELLIKDETHAAAVPLVDRDQSVGMIVITAPSEGRLHRAQAALEPILASLARGMKEIETWRRFEVRVREAETCLTVVESAQGSTTAATLASRVSGDLQEALRLDSVAFDLVDEGMRLPLGSAGERLPVFESLSFAKGPGFEGWLAIGAPELLATDALEDGRVDRKRALRGGVGSFAAVPLRRGGRTLGVLVAATRRAGGIDANEIDALRSVATHASAALERLGGSASAAFISPNELFAAAKEIQNGCLATVELMHREAAIRRHGPSEVDRATRRLASRLEAELPEGAKLCRRTEGDFVVLLPNHDQTAGLAWADQVTASAGLRWTKASDAETTIALTARSRVAELNASDASLAG